MQSTQRNDVAYMPKLERHMLQRDILYCTDGASPRVSPPLQSVDRSSVSKSLLRQRTAYRAVLRSLAKGPAP